MASSVALLLAQGSSRRLPGKNRRDFHGEPMYLVNTKKCLRIFSRVYVSSDNDWILEGAEDCGAIPIKRPPKLCGEVPNIPVYQHALQFMNGVDNVVCVQVNSPTVDSRLIEITKELLEKGFEEVMTMHEDRSIYGSIWAIKANKLRNYGDPYKPQPNILLLDRSTDIHTEEDLQKALCQK